MCDACPPDARAHRRRDRTRRGPSPQHGRARIPAQQQTVQWLLPPVVGTHVRGDTARPFPTQHAVHLRGLGTGRPIVVQRLEPGANRGRCARGHVLSISHETISRYIWRDKKRGGALHVHLRRANEPFRKRYDHYDSRGRLGGKRPIASRPAGAANRSRLGHWEGDTVLSDSQGGACILTLVDRRSRFTMIGKLARRTGVYFNARARQLIRAQPRPVHTITADNGTDFRAYKQLEATLDTRFYFATPHHSWERGTNENTNGLIRQYLPKRASMEHVTQRDCTRIATKLNQRPRKCLGFRTPEECYEP